MILLLNSFIVRYYTNSNIHKSNHQSILQQQLSYFFKFFLHRADLQTTVKNISTIIHTSSTIRLSLLGSWESHFNPTMINTPTEASRPMALGTFKRAIFLAKRDKGARRQYSLAINDYSPLVSFLCNYLASCNRFCRRKINRKSIYKSFFNIIANTF